MTQEKSFLKRLRSSRGLSQRQLAERSQISFRQIQRVENGTSDISLGKFQSLMESFGYDLRLSPKEPDWNILSEWGFALSVDDHLTARSSLTKFQRELVQAMSYLFENKTNPELLRHLDCLKAMLLVLKIHYPKIFSKLSSKGPFPDISKSFDLDRVEGRHIKLRNISLTAFSNRKNNP